MSLFLSQDLQGYEHHSNSQAMINCRTFLVVSVFQQAIEKLKLTPALHKLTTVHRTCPSQGSGIVCVRVFDDLESLRWTVVY